MRRRRQGRKSPGNNSSAQEAAASLELYVELALWGGGRAGSFSSSPKSSLAGVTVKWCGGGKPGVGTESSLGPWVLKAQEASLSAAKGNPLDPPLFPFLG